MAEQLAGTATVLVLVLGYVLIVQAMTAAVVLLAEFIILRAQVVRRLLAAIEGKPKRSPQSALQVADQAPNVVGGGLKRWN